MQQRKTTQSKLFYIIKGRGLPLYDCIVMPTVLERMGLKILYKKIVRSGEGEKKHWIYRHC